MTQEDKELLRKDLCARLPYSVHIYTKMNNSPIRARVMLDFYHIRMLNQNKFEFIKPYLFPLSSMTEEQRQEFENITTIKDGILTVWTTSSYDWLNENHFDYRGLIKKGFAIDATGLNIY